MDVAAEVQGVSGFSLELHQVMVKMEKNGVDNLAVSPLSIAITLALASAGAKGATSKQIAGVLKLPEGDPLHEFSSQLRSVVLADASGQGGPLLNFVNRAWVEQTLKLKPAFQKLLKDSYGTEAGPLDFVHEPNEARKKVNAWASSNTNGRIEELLPEGSIDARTRLVLSNAVYFKGAWEKPFDESSTKDSEFYLLDGTSLKVPMMQTKKNQYIKSFPTFKVLRLRYAAGNDKRIFSMYILLPHEKNGLQHLEESLTPEELWHALSQVTLEVPVTNFQLPKFKISCGFDVLQALETLGLTLPFSQDADFTEMVDSPIADNLYISNIFHKAFVEVNEKGTEAAAATAAVIRLKCALMFEKSEEFVADHPFLFVIKEELTKVILFTGHVTNPTNPN